MTDADARRRPSTPMRSARAGAGAEIAFWLLALRYALPVSARYLILTEIAIARRCSRSRST